MNTTWSSGRLSARALAVVAVAVVLILCFAAGAQAGYASSSWGYYYDKNGKDYRVRSDVYTASSIADSYTRLEGYGNSVPTGWMAAQARLYKTGDSLHCASTYKYSGSTYSSGQQLSANSCRGTTRDTWHSKGKARLWLGTSYGIYWAFQSPSQNS